MLVCRDETGAVCILYYVFMVQASLQLGDPKLYKPSGWLK